MKRNHCAWMGKLCLMGILGAIGLTAEVKPDFYGGDNLVPAEMFRDDISFCNRGYAWRHWNRNKVIQVKDGAVYFRLQQDGRLSEGGLQAEKGFFGDYLADGASLELSFRYKTDVPGAFCRLTFEKIENDSPRAKPFSQQLTRSADWKDVRVMIPVPLGTDRLSLMFGGPWKKAQGTELAVTDVCVREIAPAPGTGRPLLINGRECQAIYWQRTQEPFTSNDYRAAQMLRFALQRCGGKLIPIVELKKGMQTKDCAVFMGKAAETAGAVDLDGKGKLKGVDEGGASIKVSGHRLGIAGHKYAGASFGVYNFLWKKLDIAYLACNVFTFPPGKDFQVTDCNVVANPCIPIRDTSWHWIERPELRGFSPLTSGDWSGYLCRGGGGHAGNTLAPEDELRKEHPDFLARNDKGEIYAFPAGPHYCNSNRAFQKFYGKRLMEVMNATPMNAYYLIAAGDGCGYNCRCKNCAALGNYSDQLLTFANAVAEITSAKFPDKYVAVFSYVDNPFPPTRVKPHKNVLIVYCAYKSDVWGATSNYMHDFNAEGRRLKEQWDKACEGHMGLYEYGCVAWEINGLFPAFKFNSTIMQQAADRHYKLIQHLSRTPEIPGRGQHSSFLDLGYFAYGRQMTEPGQDAEKLADWFISRFYGNAAKPMKQYFDIVQQEPIRRNWAQHVEEIKRGLVTQKLAEQCLPILDQALRLTAGTKAQRRVNKERFIFLWNYLYDVCPGRGNVTDKNFKFYARNLSELLKLVREMHYWHLGYGRSGVTAFFNDMVGFALQGKGGWKWWLDPTVQKLIDNPEKYLKLSRPVVQEKLKDGFKIPPKGMRGGVPMLSDWMRKDKVECVQVRRQPFGTGILRAVLMLDKLPPGKATLTVNGLDNEKVDVANLGIRINEKTIFTGRVPWQKKTWSKASFPIPEGVLKQGENAITLLNTTPEKDKAAEGGRVVEHTVSSRANYFWGWFMLDSMEIRWKP